VVPCPELKFSDSHLGAMYVLHNMSYTAADSLKGLGVWIISCISHGAEHCSAQTSTKQLPQLNRPR
jgi:hypothetical protein